MTFFSQNPYTGICFEKMAASNRIVWDEQLEKATSASQKWASLPLSERTRPIGLLSQLLEREKEHLAHLCAEEMGKPLSQGLAEVEKCIRLCIWCRDHAAEALADRIVKAQDLHARIAYRPLGPLLGIMPWNFPYWQTLRFGLPALTAGNPVLIKPAPQMLRASRALDKIMQEAFRMEGLYQTVYLDVEDIEAFVGVGIIAGVSLTGSARAGRVVAKLAGAHLLPSVLELGGSDPFILLPDAPLEKAVWTAYQSRMANNGQTCLAAKRFIVHEQVREAFVEQFSEMLRRAPIGDPLTKDTFFTCLAREDLAQNLEDQLSRAMQGGAKELLRVKRPGGRATHFAPALVADANPESPLWREEVFGPVAVLRGFETREEMLRLANDTAYGLGATIWTTDIDAAVELAAGIQAGTVAVNGQVRSDPRLPFGGVKHSGYGRELGLEGFRVFCNVQTIILPA